MISKNLGHIEGQTLEQRLAKGAVPVPDST